MHRCGSLIPKEWEAFALVFETICSSRGSIYQGDSHIAPFIVSCFIRGVCHACDSALVDIAIHRLDVASFGMPALLGRFAKRPPLKSPQSQ